MCLTCGCADHPAVTILPGHGHDHDHGHEHSHDHDHDHEAHALELQPEVRLLAQNARWAEHNRQHFRAHGVLAVNLMSSPGAGKTALLEATLEAWQGRYRVAVVEGDLATELDAQRIRAKGVEAVQIATGSACHLDAAMVHQALHHLDLSQVELLFIENVGNLVCPAAFDLGQQRQVVLLACTEGDDKPAKYPVIFRAADLVLVSKADLLPVLGDFAPAKAEQALRQLASVAPLYTLSARSGEGLAAWLEWLERELVALRGQEATP